MVTVLLLAALAAFTFDEDFSVKDEWGGSSAIEIERHSALSHGHGEVNEDGYTILVPGNRHYLAMPPVGDFRLEVDYSFHVPKLEFGAGYDVFLGDGHTVRIYFDAKGSLGFYLDGTKFADGAVRFDDAIVGHSDRLRIEMKSDKLSVSAFGCTAVASGVSLGRGKVGFDMRYSNLNQLTFSHVWLESDDVPAKREFPEIRFSLSRCQGFSHALVYEVRLSRFETGETELALCLRGLCGDATNRLESGGREWGSIVDRIDTPYLRIEDAGGSEFAVLPLWNGSRLLRDPVMTRRAYKRNKHDPEAAKIAWPICKRYVFGRFPESGSLAAGYRAAMENPNRLAGNGPYEQIRDFDGRLLYEGDSIRRGHVAVKVTPVPDARFVARIPKDLPRYAEAVRHASAHGYFLESTVPTFNVEIATHPGEFDPADLNYTASTQTVFGDPVAEGACLPVGVYRYVVKWRAGAKSGSRDFIFEVLPEDPDGICPPVASKLPLFYSMPNETKYLEETVFDPWSEFGGVQHYYSLSTHYPSIGVTNRIWDALKPYRRRWFAQNNNRNMAIDDPFTDENCFINRRADITYSLDDGARYGDLYDFTAPEAFRAKQARLLADYVAERRPKFKVLTDARIAELRHSNKGMTADEFRDFYNECWPGFRDWARPRVDAMDSDFERKLLSVNPKLARAGYGPASFYLSTYKTPYWLMACSKGLSTLPEMRDNGSFWVFEEYHHSCDYPIRRGAFFVAAYSMLYPTGRRIYPEIYYSAWGRCLDGAVFQAHPGKYRFVDVGHQKRIVYDYVYGTPFFRDGAFGYWKDYGFHARNPERETMETFVEAWGKTVKNPPDKPVKAPFAMVDVEAFRRYGDYLETECDFEIEDGPVRYGGCGDVCNLAEESVAYIYEVAALGGRSTPILATLKELDAIRAEACSFVVLPPIVAGTSSETLAAIRRLHARGVGLIASDRVVGLEDLFGVRPCAPRDVTALEGEHFSHRLATAKYATVGAEILLAGNDGIPIVLTHRTSTGRTVFINVPPTALNRAAMRGRYTRGQPNVSSALRRGVGDAIDFLDPKPQVFASCGEVCAAFTESGDLIVTVGDECPIYRNATEYPRNCRLTVRLPNADLAVIETDVAYAVTSRASDAITLWAELQKDSALFFKFTLPKKQGKKK